MFKIAIMGTGKSVQPILKSIINTEDLCLFCDNNPQKIGNIFQGKSIISPYELKNYEIDYIVIATIYYKKAYEQLEAVGIPPKKWVGFYDETINYDAYSFLFDINKWRLFSLETRMNITLEQLEKRKKAELCNLEYEIAYRVYQKTYIFPNICSVQETVRKIREEHVSISRYGDGEFQIIAGHAKDVYQDDNPKLGKRLKDILKTNEQNHIVALADDYGTVNQYNEDIKYAIRNYMTEEKRKFHYSLLDFNKQYYNAYISRPYIIYNLENTSEAKRRFQDLKTLWDKRKVVFIEGEKTRMGVGNDLFSNTTSIERIIVPSKNAFNQYDEIIEKTRLLGKDKLILAALGPTATVLAYDLSLEGYQVLDIGHLDLEYEWFLKGKGASYILNKYNNEVPGDEYTRPINDEKYNQQIISKIGV